MVVQQIDFSKLTPSIVLQAAVDGIRENVADERFRVDMGTFGEAGYEKCYGCLATCALAKMHGALVADVMQTSDPLSRCLSLADQEYWAKLRIVEVAVDAARMGSMIFFIEDLAKVLPIKMTAARQTAIKSLEDQWFINTGNWQTELPKMEAAIKLLKEARL
jgi:hypothetical protein